MDRASERDRSSRRSRDLRDGKDRDRDPDSSRGHHHHHHRDRDGERDRDPDRDREHKHRHHHHHKDDEKRRRDDDDDRRRRRRRSRDDDDDEESSPSDTEPKRERSSSRVRDSVERDGVPREHSVERRHASRKRKEQGRDEEEPEREEKRARVSDGGREEKRERRRFEDDANGVVKDRRRRDDSDDTEVDRKEKKSEEGSVSNVDDRKQSRDARRFSDSGIEVDKKDLDEKETKREHRVKDRAKDGDLGHGEKLEKIEVTNGHHKIAAAEKGGSTANLAALEPLSVASKLLATSVDSHHPLPTKVSSITTTNENEGVSIRSDEVPGKSSTDGTATSLTSGKSGSLSLDALAKAKKALQLQKELSEKLKKIPVLSKIGTSGSSSSQVAPNKDESKTPSLNTGTKPISSGSLTVSANPAQTMTNLATAASMTGKPGVLPGLPSIPNLEAVKRAQELAAKMGFRQDPEFAPLINMFPGPSVAPSTDVVAPQKPAKAPVLRLDAQGREIDEHGNVINVPKLANLSTLKVNINKQKKEAFQIIKPDLDAIAESNPHFDESMGINKTKLLRPKRPGFQFLEEGKMSRMAELQRIKNQFGEAQAKELKVKQTQLAKAKAEGDINPNLITVAPRVTKEKQKEEIPEIEWWDKQILLSGTYEDFSEEKLNKDKITIYIEHPRPIEPPADPAPPPPQPLKLTKKEQKKLRTQRRLAKERDRQEMIRQGLLEPPKPKVKMSNLMKVLSSEATQDPTRLEMEIRSAAAEREQAHVDRNIARKLTPAERREKKERKLFDDPNSLETLVSVYRIRDLSHPQTRFKVDVNAQENRLTGCAVISDGGKKPIKRYGKLMLRRIDWAAAVNDEEEGDEVDPDKPVNSCVLVWQGSVAKPGFHKFIVHQCRTEAAARKVFADAGVPHYWDLAVNFSEELL
ncbi:U4/U6 small nuclear ribonucleoprotein Prp3 [Ananas comosus]|uniref:U4/U6 small nuclear ribonucleoprotein Prp3 n=1 Tax=Ananas comosus TaxID=4615 RepID=A0A199VPY9_ANACO|nr:U4/U6 small nuclear ribonucleoprotein Prp3 [Ananas comosus]